MSNDGFCDLCEVSLDLHDGPDTCESADAKARTIEMFFGAFGRR